MTERQTLEMALEALNHYEKAGLATVKTIDAITAIKEALAQPEQDNTYVYASSLATAIWQKHYIKESPKFALLDTTEGVLTQIDNMTCGLVREKPEQPEQEPVAWVNWCAATGKRSVSFECESELASQPLYTKEQS